MNCLAYLITFRTYGSWLPGDERGFVDHARQGHGATQRDAHAGLHRAMTPQRAHEIFIFDEKCRALIQQVITSECQHRRWNLHAVAVRTNHVHLVVSECPEPEKVMNTLKSWSTRHLREAGHAPPNVKLWARHGSTKYLWNATSVEAACRYVIEGQGDDIPA